MLLRSVRRFATTAYRTAELASHIDASYEYRVHLAKSQGHVNGLVGGMNPLFQWQ